MFASHPDPSRRSGAWCRQKRSHLDRRPARDDSLALPRRCLVQIGSFQYPKTAYVLLSLQVRSVGDEHFTIGLPPQRSRAAGRAEAAGKKPDTRSLHLIVERVDIAHHRFALCGRVVVVGDVNSNQILRHDLAGRLPCLHYIVVRDTGNRQPLIFFYFDCRIRSCRNCRSGSYLVSARAFP